MSKVKVIIEPDDNMTFGELEEVRKAVAGFVIINGRYIQGDEGTIIITGVLMPQSTQDEVSDYGR